MAALKKFGNLSNQLVTKNKCVPYIINTALFHVGKNLKMWNMLPKSYEEFMPGPYPKTEKERLEAAKKYGLHPDEYKPEPNDEFSIGDYPQMPFVGVEAQDPYYPWDFPGMRKNYGDPIHREFDLIGADRWAAGVRTFVEPKHVFKVVICFFVTYLFIVQQFADTKPPFAEKQYPGKGVHYIFESAK